MKIIIKLFCVILSLSIISIICEAQDKKTNGKNEIRLGTGKIALGVCELFSPVPTPEGGLKKNSVDIHIFTQSIFDKDGEFNEIPLNKTILEDGLVVFYGEVPLECISEICNVSFYNGNGEFSGGTMVELNQVDPIQISVTLDNGGINDFYIHNQNQPSGEEWQTIAGYIQGALNTLLPDFIATDITLYEKSWQDVRKNQYDIVWPRILNKVNSYAPIPESAKDWVMNNIKLRFASQGIIPYTGVYNMITGKSVEEPPMEAYSYLDSIDYSPEIFLTKSMLMSQRNFLSNLLRYPCGGFEAIGETPVKEWQEKLSDWLAPAMKERPKLLLDLLAGMSYVMQIDDMKPLSDVQKKNIEEGFTDDIGKIVLKRNEKLEEALSQKVNLQDLSEQTFAIQEFIDKTYPGQPVVVDMWNTWCGPCLQAMSQTEEIKGDYADSDLVFLYVSDTSSDLKQWENRARMTGGEQVRINEESKNALMDKYSLDGFPSYLFFDNDHKLVHAQTTFPGLDRYRAFLNQITGK